MRLRPGGTEPRAPAAPTPTDRGLGRGAATPVVERGVDREGGAEPRGKRRRAPRARPWLAAGLLAFGACGGGSAEGSRALRELEGLAHLPPTRCFYPAELLELRTDGDLLVDRFEVTRGAWREYLAGAPGGELAEEAPGWAAETLDWPVAFMSFEGALGFASWRGMRLPTPEEWILVAGGPRAYRFPWGDIPQTSVANTLELGLRRPSAVGTFEGGRTPQGCYDLLGNVWEWTDGPVPREGAADRRAVFGGSYLSWRKAIYGGSTLKFFARALDRRTRARDVGLRCVVDAESYLRERARDWGSGDPVAARLRAVGRRWGRSALPMLERVSAEPGAHPSLQHLVEGARR